MQNDFSAQGSNIREIDEALATASKKGTGNVGFPEYVGVINDFLVVIEDKASLNKHLNRDENDLIAEDVKSVTDYAVNGALDDEELKSLYYSYRIVYIPIQVNRANQADKTSSLGVRISSSYCLILTSSKCVLSPNVF